MDLEKYSPNQTHGNTATLQVIRPNGKPLSLSFMRPRSLEMVMTNRDVVISSNGALGG